jgi:hypothetical protein
MMMYRVSLDVLLSVTWTYVDPWRELCACNFLRELCFSFHLGVQAFS